MSGKSPAISVLIPWKDRKELEYTLERNQSAFETGDAEVLVINCGGDCDSLVKIQQRLKIPFLRIIETNQNCFNKSLGLNLGSFFAHAPVLMVLDADVVLEPGLLVSMRERLDAGVFIAVEWMQESTDLNTIDLFVQGKSSDVETIRTNTTEFRFADGTTHRVITHRYSLSKQRRSGLSLLLLRKTDFLAVQGFHSGISSWGWEDNDLHLRLQWKCGLTVVELGGVLHISHDDSQRALQGKSQMDSLNANLLSAASRYGNGDLAGTYLADLASWGPSSHEVLP